MRLVVRSRRVVAELVDRIRAPVVEDPELAVVQLGRVDLDRPVQHRPGRRIARPVPNDLQPHLGHIVIAGQFGHRDQPRLRDAA